MPRLASNAHKTGHLIKIESASKYLIAAKLTLDWNAQAAIRDLSLTMVFVTSVPSILWFLLMLDARLGIGTNKFVRSVLPTGFPAMVSVFQLILFARPMIPLELVHPVSKAIRSLMAYVPHLNLEQ